MAKKASKAAVSDNTEAVAQPEAPATQPEPAALSGAESETMPCATCGQQPAQPTQFDHLVDVLAPAPAIVNGVLMKFTGRYEAPVQFLGLYQGCVTCPHVQVDPGHVVRLEGTGMWAVVETPEAQS